MSVGALRRLRPGASCAVNPARAGRTEPHAARPPAKTGCPPPFHPSQVGKVRHGKLSPQRGETIEQG
jgi:hypothetical protein